MQNAEMELQKHLWITFAALVVFLGYKSMSLPVYMHAEEKHNGRNAQ